MTEQVDHLEEAKTALASALDDIERDGREPTPEEKGSIGLVHAMIAVAENVRGVADDLARRNGAGRGRPMAQPS